MELRSETQCRGIERSLQRAWAKGAGLADEEFERPMIAVSGRERAARRAGREPLTPRIRRGHLEHDAEHDAPASEGAVKPRQAAAGRVTPVSPRIARRRPMSPLQAITELSRRGAILLGASALLAGVAGLSLPGAASAETFKVKIAHVDTVEHPKHLAFLKFKNLVEERSEGRLEVTVFHGGQLGDERENVEGAQLGTVHLACVSNGVMVPFSETFMLLDIPFLFEDYDQARAIIDARGQALLFEGLEEIGLVGLAIWEQGYRNVSTSSKAIRTLEDIEGMKIRTMEAPLHVTAFRGLGSNPTPMSFSQLYTSLQQGVVDGQENPLYVLTQEKFYEVQDYVALTRHIYDPMPVIASKRWMDSLPADLQAIVTEAMVEVTDYERQVAEALVEEAAKELPGLGVEVVALAPEERARFRAAAQPPVIERVREALGNQAVDDWLAAVGQ